MEIASIVGVKSNFYFIITLHRPLNVDEALKDFSLEKLGGL